MKYVLAYDVGTTGVKTCIFKVDKKIELIANASAPYPLFSLPNGGAEQEPNDWWKGMKETTKKVLAESKIKPELIEGLSFCSQMQAVVLVDKDGVPVRRAMSYMDQRATEEVKKGMSHGLQIAGANIFKLIPSLRITGAVTSSAKDPVWKFKWVEAHEPENFKKAYKWLDVKEYLIHRCTNEFIMTEDSAFATLIFDNRKKHMCWSKKMCKMFKINMDILPRVIKSTDLVGGLTKEAAKELGLKEGTKVFGGGGDSSLIGVGAGATNVGDTHIYCGTSGWVNTVVDHRQVDTSAMIAAICGAETGKYNYFAEMETAGKCFEWVKDHLARDEIILYLREHREFKTFEEKSKALFAFLNEKIKHVPAGSNGVIFTPWLHGNRCPFEDPYAVGMFYGLKLETGKTEMIRSVLEGIYFHLRWMLECQDHKIKTSAKIRFVGGGAISPISCQMLADVLGREIETVASPQNVGAVGAAAIVAVGLGLIPDLSSVKNFIPVSRTFLPRQEVHEQYNPNFYVFKNLHKCNKKNFKELHDKSAKDKDKKKAEVARIIKFVLFSISAGVIQLASTAIVEAICKSVAPGSYIATTAYLIGLVLSVIWNFTFNRKFTFKSATNVPKSMGLAFLFYVFFAPASLFLTAFLTTGDVLGFFANNPLFHINLPDIVGTIICMVLNFALEFLWQRFVVFRNSIDTNKK